MDGVFITFEGIEGCGKSTQAGKLYRHLVSRGLSAILTREPGDGVFGEKIRHILLHTDSIALDPRTELFLLLADRAQHVATLIRPALANGTIVISDRYADSSVAYQGYGRGLSIDRIRAMNTFATQGIAPDITFLIDLDQELSLNRSKMRLKQQNLYADEGRFEDEAMDFHLKVRNGFQEIARRDPDRFVVLDGSLSISALQDIILNKVRHLIAKISPDWDKND